MLKNIPITELKPYPNNPRKNDHAVDAVAASIREFGFKVPLVIDKDGVIVAGHTRYKAAQKLSLKELPCIVADDLTDDQIKAFRLADNKTAELAEWDFELLNLELDDIELDMEPFGFAPEEEIPQTERKEAAFHESISVVIDCHSDEEAERVYNQLMEEGFECRISTL